jgi:hypothetical protein
VCSSDLLGGSSVIAGGVTVQGGSLVVDGSLAAASPLVVANGGTLGGSGSIGGTLTVQGGGTLSPGSSPGTLSSLGQTWMDGGNLNWQIHDANGAAGVGYDTLAITGTLDLTGLTGAPDFQINLWSLASVVPDADGNAINFNPNLDYTWTLATASGGILGFDAGNFAVNTAANNGTAGFANPLNGSFAVEVDGTALNLVYAAIPEPSTALVLLFGLAVLGWARRR